MSITVTRAGKLIVDEDGYVTAHLASIEVVDHPVDPQTGEHGASPEYNLLTQMLLALGTLSEESLKSDDQINFDIESLVGRAFKSHVVPNHTKPSLSDIVVKSMRFAETDVRLAVTNATK